MNFSAAILKKMAAMGLTIEQIVELAEAFEAEKPVKSKNAERQARYRERHRVTEGVTSNVTRDVTDNVTSLAPSLPPTPPNSPINPNPPSPPTGAHGSTPIVRLAVKPNGFARFWEAYPDKVGKRAAATAYERALKRVNEPDAAGVILAGVERAKLSRRWREGFVPNPATWLNQDRWTDEPEERSPEPTGMQPRGPPTYWSEQERLARQSREAAERLKAEYATK